MTDPRDFRVRCADHVGFSVVSLGESLRFWIEGLGEQLVRTGEMGEDFLGEVTGVRGAKVRLAIVSLADQSIELLEYRGLGRAPEPPRPLVPAFANLALVVDGVDAVLGRIATYGWRAQGIPQTIATGTRAGTKVIDAVGPDGATIELMEPLVAADTGR